MKMWPLIAGGLGFGVPYVASVAIAAGSEERSPTPWLNVPVAGPWIFVAKWAGPNIHSSGIDDPGPGFAWFASDVVLIIDGGLQAAGLVLLTYGALAHETVVVSDTQPAQGGVRMIPVPAMLGRGAPALSVVGTF